MSKKEVTREVNKTFDRKVYDAINYYCGNTDNKFAKLLVLVTPNMVYWAKDNFKSKNQSDVAKHNGVKLEDMIIVEGNSAYGSSDFEAFMFEPSNKYFFRIRFYIGCRVSGGYWGARLQVGFRHAIKIYPDKCCQVTDNATSFDNFENNLNISKLYQRKELKRWMGNTCVYSDIATKIIMDPAATEGWRKELDDNTFAKFKQFFLDNNVAQKYLDDLDKHVLFINNFMNKANVSSSATAANTREKLLRDIFIPMYDKVRKWVGAKGAIPCKEYDDWLKKHPKEKDCRSQYYGPTIRPCVVRDGDWIMCLSSISSWSKIVFYNAKSKKKYMANKHSDSINNYGVFNIDYFSVLPSTSQYYNYHNTYYINHYDYTNRLDENFLTDDIEYVDSMKMYDIDGNEISYEECFEDTPIVGIVQSAMKQPLTKIISDCIECIKNKQGIKVKDIISKIDIGEHTVEKIINLNRIPIMYFLILCLKKDYQLAAEQLAKSGYNGLLYQMVTDQNTFKGKDEESNHYWSSIILFDKTQTNLKGAFSMNAGQLRVIDKWIENNDSPRNIGIISYPEILFGKDRVRGLDEQTFKDLLNYFKKYNIERHNIEEIPRALEAIGHKQILNNPKETLTIFNKVGDLSIWKDYLNMISQLKDLIKIGALDMDIKKYKVIPDKATRYIHLREKPRQYRWGDQSATISTAEQFNDLSRYYKNTKAVFDDNGNICGAVLEVSIPEHARFLHDELSCLISVYRNKEKDKLFKLAAERVKKYEWENDDIAIIAPKQASDVVNDASALCHCAASFVDPIINGTENIMFIRKKDMKDVPWYTMAIDNMGNIEQIHSYANSHLSIEEQRYCLERSKIPSYIEQIDFIPMLKKWAKEKGINVATIKERYGALCAHR